jgi:hypothetical protein
MAKLSTACESCGHPMYGIEQPGSRVCEVCRLSWPLENLHIKDAQAKLRGKGLGASSLSDKKIVEPTRALADRLKTKRAAGGDVGMPVESSGTGELKPTM